MSSVAWAVLHVAQDAALLACAAMAALASRRIGSRTPYGTLLFTLGLGFTLLLLADLLFVARVLTGAWDGPGTVADVVGLCGWLAVLTAFVLFVVRFPRAGGAGPLRRTAVVAAVAVVPCLAILALFRLVLSPPGADPDAAVRAAYLAVDGLTLGVLLAGVERFVRLRHSDLGRTFSLLGLALVVKTIGDLAWAYLAARGGSSVLATATAPVAGAIAVAALAFQVRVLVRDPGSSHRLADPSLRVEQRMLRDMAWHLRGVAGAYASGLLLSGAVRALAARGLSSRVVGDVIESDAPPEAWADAVQRACAEATARLGEAAREPIARVAAAYAGREAA